MTILVAPLAHVLSLVKQRSPARVISLLDPTMPFPELGAAFTDRHLRLTFHDAHEPAPGVILPSLAHMERLLKFLAAWEAHELLLVHCRAGIGRSTATAYAAACYRHPHASEFEIATELRRVAPFARPNEALVALADTALGRSGRMQRAIADTGRGLSWVNMPEAQPFEFASTFASNVAPGGESPFATNRLFPATSDARTRMDN